MMLASAKAYENARPLGTSPPAHALVCDALAAFGLPAALLDAAGLVTTRNDALAALGDIVLAVPGELLRLANALDHKALMSALDRLRVASEQGREIVPLTIQSTVRPGRRGVMALRRLPSPAIDLSPSDRPILLIVETLAPRSPDLDLLQATFAFTRSEASIAAALAAGKAIGTIAAQRGVAVGTVRVQIKTIMAKTGSRRQGELLLLLAAISRLDAG